MLASRIASDSAGEMMSAKRRQISALKSCKPGEQGLTYLGDSPELAIPWDEVFGVMHAPLINHVWVSSYSCVDDESRIACVESGWCNSIAIKALGRYVSAVAQSPLKFLAELSWKSYQKHVHFLW